MKNVFIIIISIFFGVGCNEPEYDFKRLGFTSAQEMQSAHAAGYHTKAKLDEMAKANNPIIKATKSVTEELENIVGGNSDKKNSCMEAKLEKYKKAYGSEPEPNDQIKSEWVELCKNEK